MLRIRIGGEAGERWSESLLPLGAWRCLEVPGDGRRWCLRALRESPGCPPAVPRLSPQLPPVSACPRCLSALKPAPAYLNDPYSLFSLGNASLSFWKRINQKVMFSLEFYMADLISRRRFGVPAVSHFYPNERTDKTNAARDHVLPPLHHQVCVIQSSVEHSGIEPAKIACQTEGARATARRN